MKLLNFAFLSLSLITWSCQSEDIEDKITGSGVLKSETRAITNTNINEIQVNGDFTTSFSTRNDISKIFVLAEDNLIPYILTNESNGTIKIKEKEGFTIANKEPLIVDVKSATLNGVTINGNGKFIGDLLHGANPYITVNGSGTAEINDIKENSVNITVNGNGFIELNGSVATANLLINGNGVIQINANCTTLNIRINGSGVVYYVGSPKLNTIIEGTGKVLKINE